MDLQQLRSFYLSRTDNGDTLFETWERGAARGDSVTPASYSSRYRRWMRRLLRGLLDAQPGGLVSVGCGNALVEAELAGAGYRVLAVDALAEAVELARRKGVDAVRADAADWSPPPGRWTVVYADGVLGHLCDAEAGLVPALRRFRSWLAGTEGTLVVSNDHTRDTAADTQPASGVPGFFWLSEEFLRKQAAAAGFHELSCTQFEYRRPLSGPRTRVVLTARA